MKVVQYVYTIHAEEKLTLPRVKKFRITENRIQKVIEKPIAVDISEHPIVIAIGKLTKTLSLYVVYKKIEKGRYEHKILPK